MHYDCELVHLTASWEKKSQQFLISRKSLLLLVLLPFFLLHSSAGLYRFHEDVEKMVQVIEAPLWGNKASMALLMPFHVEGLQRLDKLLSVEQLFKWLDKANKTSMSVSLPVANITSILSLQVSTSEGHCGHFKLQWMTYVCIYVLIFKRNCQEIILELKRKLYLMVLSIV